MIDSKDKNRASRSISSRDLLHSMVSIVNNTIIIIYLKTAKGLDLKCSHHIKELIIICHIRGVN